MNPLLLRFSIAGTRFCRQCGLDEQAIDFEAFYDFGLSFRENKQLLISRINSLARQLKESDFRENIDRFRDYYNDPSNNPNSLCRFLQDKKA